MAGYLDHFGLKIAPIELEQGSWAGARSILMPGAVVAEGGIAGAGSVVSGRIPSYQIFAGNPAVFVKERALRTVDATLEPQWQEAGR